MNNSNLTIFEEDGRYNVFVRGRANFDYAVPLRELSKKLSPGFSGIVFEMSGCTAVDSTFMGVMTMLSMAARKRGRQTVLCNVTPQVRQLLRGLGVEKLFVFEENTEIMEKSGTSNGGSAAASVPGIELERARTVVEAHQTLVEADSSNEAKFAKVLEFAGKDLENLEKKAKSGSDE